MMKTMFGFMSAPCADDRASAARKSAAVVLLSMVRLLEVNGYDETVYGSCDARRSRVRKLPAPGARNESGDAWPVQTQVHSSCCADGAGQARLWPHLRPGTTPHHPGREIETL